MNFLKRLLADESGLSAVEYGLVAGLIVAALPVVIGPLGAHVAAGFNTFHAAFCAIPAFACTP